MGILLHKTGEVFDGKTAEKVRFSGKNTIVQGVFKLDGGKRIVQILDPYEIVNLDRLPRTVESDVARARRRKNGQRSKCISFKVGDSLCALNIEAIQEIVKLGKLEESALSGGLCLGVATLREAMVPIVDFCRVLGYETSEVTEPDERRIIVMRLEDQIFGLLVNRVENILSYFKEEIVPFPVVGDRRKEMFLGCLSLESAGEVIVLDHNEVLTNAEIDDLTRGHNFLYKNNTINSSTEKNDLNKTTFILFSIGDSYALEISEVKEIIDLPKSLMKPPNLLDRQKGMINLRGELIPIVDPRAIYGLEKETDVADPKILIFKIDDVPHGLIVDSVDEIVTFDKSSLVKLPDIMFRNDEGVTDIKQAYQKDWKDESEKKTIFQLSLVGLAERVFAEKKPQEDESQDTDADYQESA